ncbi:MAG: hypothetical protein ACXVB1_04160 [Pseudobdellovibrionaceae bacterium]
MNKLILGILFFAPALCLAVDMNARLTDLENSSKFLVNLSDPELLANGKREWRIQNGHQIVKTCRLEIRSYYNKSLVEKSGAVIYTIDQNNPGSSIDFYNKESRDHFSLWLTTSNKDLPLVLLDCFWAVEGDTQEGRHFTLQNVAEFIQQPQFFYDPVLKEYASKTAFELLPMATLAQLRVDLEFSSKEDSNGFFSITQPTIKDGKVTTAGVQAPSCSIGYHSPQTDRGAYHLVLSAGPLLRVQYMTETLGYYHIELDSPDRLYNLTVTCSFSPNPAQNFSEFKAQLDNVIDIH